MANARHIWGIFLNNANNKYRSNSLICNFQKEVYSVEWNFLIKALEKHHFRGKRYKMDRGIRQECPVSAILFLFVWKSSMNKK